MINILSATAARLGSIPILQSAAQQGRSVFTAVAADVVSLYRTGGLLGVLAGVFVSVVLSQTRKLDR